MISDQNQSRATEITKRTDKASDFTKKIDHQISTEVNQQSMSSFFNPIIQQKDKNDNNNNIDTEKSCSGKIKVTASVKRKHK